MSHTLRVKIDGVLFDPQAVIETLKRMGYKRDVDFFVDENCRHDVVGYASRDMGKASIWIAKGKAKRAVGATGYQLDNEIGFRADDDGNLEIVCDDYDKDATFTPMVVKEFTNFAKIEAVKIKARKRGHKKFVERKVGNQIKLYVQ